MTVAAGLFPEANYDPVPAWEHLRQPVLAQWGELDRIAVPRESSQIIRQALDRGGNTHYTIRLIPGVRHNLNRTANGGFDRIHSLPPNYGDVEASWIDGLAHGQPAPPASAQPAPRQAQPSRPLAPLAWYESPWLQLAALLLFGVAFAGYPLTAAARRLRGRRGAPLVRRPARWLAATGLATTVGFLMYLFFMLATAANVIGPVLGGRPLPWLLLQAPRRRHRRGHRRHRGGVATSPPQPHRRQPRATRRAPGRWPASSCHGRPTGACSSRRTGPRPHPAHPRARHGPRSLQGKLLQRSRLSRRRWDNHNNRAYQAPSPSCWHRSRASSMT